MDRIRAYYAQPGPMTAPGKHSSLFEGLPLEVDALVEVVQGLLLHIFWAERYGVTLSEERRQEVNLRSLSAELAQILALDDRPLTEPRPLEKKLVGNCRDFSLLLTAMLRAQGVPARARCGFGTYFRPGYYEDHWMVEYWKDEEQRWVAVDAQLDAFQQEKLRIDFDPLDLPSEVFWTGGRAWLACRAGEADPETFGIFDMRGMWFIRGDLLRDFLALNKVEILPWDHRGIFEVPPEELTPEDVAWLDHVATLCITGEETFDELRRTFEEDARARPLQSWSDVGGPP